MELYKFVDMRFCLEVHQQLNLNYSKDLTSNPSPCAVRSSHSKDTMIIPWNLIINRTSVSFDII
ncbi:UNVERIFIED_CONTAM: hypothetical protein NCL1_34063 [Trichonephila clavipes]